MARLLLVARNPALAFGLAGAADEIIEVRPSLIGRLQVMPHMADLIVIEQEMPHDAIASLDLIREGGLSVPALLVASARAEWGSFDRASRASVAVLEPPITAERLATAVASTATLPAPSDDVPGGQETPEIAAETVDLPQEDQSAPESAPDAEPALAPEPGPAPTVEAAAPEQDGPAAADTPASRRRFGRKAAKAAASAAAVEVAPDEAATQDAAPSAAEEEARAAEAAAEEARLETERQAAEAAAAEEARLETERQAAEAAAAEEARLETERQAAEAAAAEEARLETERQAAEAAAAEEARLETERQAAEAAAAEEARLETERQAAEAAAAEEARLETERQAAEAAAAEEARLETERQAAEAAAAEEARLETERQAAEAAAAEEARLETERQAAEAAAAEEARLETERQAAEAAAEMAQPAEGPDELDAAGTPYEGATVDSEEAAALPVAGWFDRFPSAVLYDDEAGLTVDEGVPSPAAITSASTMAVLAWSSPPPPPDRPTATDAGGPDSEAEAAPETDADDLGESLPETDAAAERNTDDASGGDPDTERTQVERTPDPVRPTLVAVPDSQRVDDGWPSADPASPAFGSPEPGGSAHDRRVYAEMASLRSHADQLLASEPGWEPTDWDDADRTSDDEGYQVSAAEVIDLRTAAGDDPRSTPSLVRALLARSHEVYGVSESGALVVGDALARTGATAAALLLPDGDVWRVAAGEGLRRLEERFVLQADSWLVRTIADRHKGIIIDRTDVARRPLAGAPLAAHKHLVAAPVRDVAGILLIARDEDPAFAERDLLSLARLAEASGGILAAALDARLLARTLGDIRDQDDRAPADRIDYGM